MSPATFRGRALAAGMTLLLLCGQALAALDTACRFEVRQTGLDSNGGGFVMTAWIAAPSAPTVTPSGSGGTVAAGTYYVVVVYTDAVGDTVISGQTSVVTSGATASFTTTSPSASTGAKTWSHYVGTVSGGPYFPQGTGLTIGSNRVVTTTPPTTGTQPAGVDYSVQDSPQINVADGVANGTTTFTSATAAFTGSHVGNVIRVGATAWRRIVGVTNATTVVLDATVATNSSLPVVVGGAFLTPGNVGAALPAAGSSAAILYSATLYTMSASTNVAGGSIAINTGTFTLYGYNTTRTPWNRDALRPTIKPSANSTTMIHLGSTDNAVNNIALTNPDSKTTCTAFDMENSIMSNCKVNAYSAFQNDGQFCNYVFLDISCTTSVNNGSYSHMTYCDIHDGAGVLLGISGYIGFCNVYNVSATLYGIKAGSSSGFITNCNVYHQTNDSGAEVSGLHAGAGGIVVANCVVEDVNPATQTGYAFRGSGNANQAFGVQFTNCFSFNIKSATADPTNTTPTNLYGCTALTASPFTTPGSGNFALNNTTGGGALVRAASLPTTFPAGLTANAQDAGATQHAATASGMIVNPGKTGGLRSIPIRPVAPTPTKYQPRRKAA